MDRFLAGLNGVLAACGISQEKTAAVGLTSPNPHDFPGRENITAKEPRAPLDMLSGVPRSAMPEGMGRLDANGSPTSPIVSALAGKTAGELLMAARRVALARALHKLGFAKADQRFLTFGPSSTINDAQLMGICLGVLRTKTAQALPSSSLVARAATDLVAGRGPEAALASSMSPLNVAALRNTLIALTGAGGVAYAAKKALDGAVYTGRLRPEAGERPPGTVSGFDAFRGGGSMQI